MNINGNNNGLLEEAIQVETQFQLIFYSAMFVQCVVHGRVHLKLLYIPSDMNLNTSVYLVLQDLRGIFYYSDSCFISL